MGSSSRGKYAAGRSPARTYVPNCKRKYISCEQKKKKLSFSHFFSHLTVTLLLLLLLLFIFWLGPRSSDTSSFYRGMLG